MKPPATRLEIQSHSPAQTRNVAAEIGRHLPGGSLLLLEGDLGSGKTVFAQGLARGLAVPDAYAVTSPTYTLVHEYPGRQPFYHVDLYRLPEGGADLESLGLADIAGISGVTLIEWSQRLLPEEIPTQHLRVVFAPRGPQTRAIRVIAYGLTYTDLIDKFDFSRDCTAK